MPCCGSSSFLEKELCPPALLLSPSVVAVGATRQCLAWSLLPAPPPHRVHTQTGGVCWRCLTPSLLPSLAPAPSGPCIWSCAGHSSRLLCGSACLLVDTKGNSLSGVATAAASSCWHHIARLHYIVAQLQALSRQLALVQSQLAETKGMKLVVSSSLWSWLHLLLPSTVEGIMDTWDSPISKYWAVSYTISLVPLTTFCGIPISQMRRLRSGCCSYVPNSQARKGQSSEAVSVLQSPQGAPAPLHGSFCLLPDLVCVVPGTAEGKPHAPSLGPSHSLCPRC